MLLFLVVGWLLCPPPVLRVLARLLPNAFVVLSVLVVGRGGLCTLTGLARRSFFPCASVVLTVGGGWASPGVMGGSKKPKIHKPFHKFELKC